MSKNNELRRKAELELRERLNKQDMFEGEITLERMHELEVHQIELEMQNLELQQARDNLEAAHQKYADLFFGAPIGYMVCDEDGLIIQANHALLDLIGMANDSVKGLSFASFSSEKDQDLFYLHCRKVIQSGDLCSCEIEIENHVGISLCVMIESIVMIPHSGESQHIHSAVIDISKQKKVEQLLTLSTEKANKESQSKSDFLAVMSHELRTPLHGIIGLHNKLSKEVDYLLPEHQQYLEIAQHSSHLLQSLIEDILDLSKLEAGKVETNPTPFDLLGFLETVRKTFTHHAEEKNINLELVHQQLPTIIKADKALIQQILLNLIGNAIKFTEQGYVRMNVSCDDALLAISIEDSGIGIERSKIDVLFEPFMQLSQDASRQGTGLGTTIAMRLAAAMSGKINVRSKLGKGSTFTLILPVEHIEETHFSDMDSLPIKESDIPLIFDKLQTKNADELRVLLAEDDEVSRMVASMSLNDANINVDIANHGLEAWDKIQASDYDLLLTDIRMPGMDGLELTRRIREYEKDGDHHTCIIGLSAHALEDVKQECLALGMDAFFNKPINPDKLLHALGITEKLP